MPAQCSFRSRQSTSSSERWITSFFRSIIGPLYTMWSEGNDSDEAKNKLSSRESLQMKPQTAEASVLPDSTDILHSTEAPVAGADVSESSDSRRNFADRRKRTFYSLFYGSFYPRRRAARRDGPLSLRDLDWHEP